MSKNIKQVYDTSPILTNAGTDLMYFGRSPYGVTDDKAMLYSSFAAQFGAAYTASALTKADDTNVTLTLGGTPSTALLHATSITAGWTGTLSGTRGGTGVNNGASTITIGGSIAFSGAFTFTGTITGNTAVTFPTSGTLATTSQLPTPAALTKTDDTNVTLTLGGSPSTALLQATSITAGWSGQLGVARGGTGNNTFTAYSVICAGTTSTDPFQNVSGLGSAGEVLTSNGAGALPTWETGGGGGSVTPQDIQNQTFLKGTTTNIGNDYSLTLTTPISSYVTGQLFSFIPSADNTNDLIGDVVTLNVDGLGAQLLTMYTYGGNLIAQAGSLINGLEYQVLFDGLQFVILNPSNMALGQQITNQSWTFSGDTGAADAYVVAVPTLLLDPFGAILTGAKFSFKAANTNTGSSTLAVNAISAITINNNDGTGLVAGNILANSVYEVTYDGSVFILLNPSPATGGSFVTSTEVQENLFNQGVDSGIADAYDVAVTPAIMSPYGGMLLTFSPTNANATGSVTVALNGGTPITVYNYNGAPLNVGDIAGAVPTFMVADATGSSWQLINPISAGLIPKNITQGLYNYVSDGGAANAYTGTSFISASVIPGTFILLDVTNTNTTASTFNLNGGGAQDITYAGNPLTGGEMVAGQIAVLVYAASGDWNLVNAYNQGTFTPTMTCGTVGDLSVAYGAQYGSYIKTGNIVTATIRLLFTPTFTTASGSIQFAGLPFTVDNSNFIGWCGSISYITGGMVWPVGTTSLGIIAEGATDVCSIWGSGSGINSSPLLMSGLTSTVQYHVLFTVTYKAA